MVEAARGDEHQVHAQQRQRDDQETRHGAAAHRHLDRLDQAAARGRCRSNVALHADEHADDAGGHRARRSDEERDSRAQAELRAEDVRVGDAPVVLDQGDHDPDHDRADEGQDPDRRVLAANKCHRALVDRPGHVLHFDRTHVATEDIAREIERKHDGRDPRNRDDRQERTGIHQGVRSST